VKRFLALFVLIVASASAQAEAPVILVFGDSISAGYGLPLEQGWVELLRSRLKAQGYGYQVVNASVSGETTAGGLARLPRALELHHPSIVILELGGNDGLRGLPLDGTRHNLDAVLTALQAAKIRILLMGITLPPNYGADYVRSFNAVYRDAATKHHVPLMPMLYDRIYTVPGTIQEDGIHPTAKGSELIAEHLVPLLLPLLHK